MLGSEWGSRGGDGHVCRTERKDGYLMAGQTGAAQRPGSRRKIGKQPGAWRSACCGCWLAPSYTHEPPRVGRKGPAWVRGLPGGTAGPGPQPPCHCAAGQVSDDQGPQRGPPGRARGAPSPSTYPRAPSPPDPDPSATHCLFWIDRRPAPQEEGGGSGSTGV